MSSPVTTIRSTDNLEDAASLAQSVSIRHLPVVDGDGRLLGVVAQSDLLSRRLMQELVEERTVHLTTANKRLDKLARLDGLLGIGNRRWMEESLTRVHEQLQRENVPYSLALCDVDLFKLYNDHYGHLAGDRVLKKIAGRLVDVLRGADQVFRFGGEDLLVLLPETIRVEGRSGRRANLRGGTQPRASPRGVAARHRDRELRRCQRFARGAPVALAGRDPAGGREPLLCEAPRPRSDRDRLRRARLVAPSRAAQL